MATPESRRGPSRLLVFAVGANAPFPYPKMVVPDVPRPPVQTADKATLEQGKKVLDQYMCWGCHGGPALDGAGAWVLNGAVPDLRYMPKEFHDPFLAIVLGGSRRQYGMPGFADGHQNWPVGVQMSANEANALHSYIIDLQWRAYEADQKRKSVSGATIH